MTGTSFLNDIFAVETPNFVGWPTNGAPGQFIGVYDWDTIAPNPNSSNILRHRMILCTAFYPCALILKGRDAPWILSRSGNGSIACLSASGCNFVSLQDFTFSCDLQAATTTAFEIQGAAMNVSDVIFSSCSSLSDGGVVRCYGAGATVRIESSRFNASRSTGVGGSISAVGCSVTVINSSFQNSYASLGGGALSANQFQCYGSSDVIATSIVIVSCLFEGCYSQGGGGALLVSSLISSAYISDSAFTRCWTDGSGGAISASDYAVVYIVNSSFLGNYASKYGGAVSIGLSSNVKVLKTRFASNYVTTGGGGAIDVTDSSLWLKAVSCTDNKAVNGGGGAVFWSGNIQPRTAELGALSPLTAIAICGTGNTASYGQCVASAFKRLDMSQMPSIIYPGLAFAVTLSKIDFYNQTISSDSLSVLQTFSTLDEKLTPDHTVTLSGAYISNFEAGVLTLSEVLKPTFKLIDSGIGLTVLATNPAIYFRGVDVETGGTLQSSIFQLPMSSNESICPNGYVLVLDDPRLNSTLRQGACSLCAKGTYSLNPLVGVISNVPSCLNCPPSAACQGGASVNLSIGTWTVSDGFYRLIGCPRAHQLVNSINGQFSHDVQNCIACPANGYILSPNISTYSCQSCPVGAKCDGNTLAGLVAGSVWLPNAVTGVYQLISCPAGYSLFVPTQDSQQCLLCPASFFCIGGKAPSVACSDGTYAPVGSNASSACKYTVFVQLIISLPIPSENFTSDRQDQFIKAVASAAGVSYQFVILGSIVSAGRRTSSAVQVITIL